MNEEKKVIMRYLASKLPGYVKFEGHENKIKMKVGFEVSADLDKSNWINILDSSLKKMIESSVEFQNQKDLAEIFRKAYEGPVL